MVCYCWAGVTFVAGGQSNLAHLKPFSFRDIYSINNFSDSIPSDSSQLVRAHVHVRLLRPVGTRRSGQKVPVVEKVLDTDAARKWPT